MQEPMRTRGLVFHRAGTHPRIEELILDAPGPDEVRVRMAAAGVCHSDLHVIDGEWERPSNVVMGHEGSAWVESVGDGVTNVAVGDLVVLAWTAPCGTCPACRRATQEAQDFRRLQRGQSHRRRCAAAVRSRRQGQDHVGRHLRVGPGDAG